MVYYSCMRSLIVLFLAAVMLLAGSSASLAKEYSVRPFLIDVELVPREHYTETVVLRNEHEQRKYVVYATVNEISVDKEGEIKEFVTPVMTDRAVTVTSWIEVTRGRIEVPPGEEREVPLTIKVSPQALSGEYHAFVGFVPAPNRPTAENIARDGAADGVIIKVTISDQREDSMHIASFLIDRFVTGKADRVAQIEVENLGDLSSAPTGELIFYDSRGVEIDAVPVNENGLVIDPGETEVLAVTLPKEGLLGKTKANLVLEYGENQKASLQDTTFFYVVPMYILVIIGLLILLVSLFVTVLFKRTFVQEGFDEDGDEVAVFVRDGHDPDPKDHDIDLTQNK
jgi:hypothetical protein